MVDFFLLLKLAGAGDELKGIKRGIIGGVAKPSIAVANRLGRNLPSKDLLERYNKV